MSFRLVAAALAVGISIALSSTAFPRGEWPDGPNKAWFENLQSAQPRPQIRRPGFPVKLLRFGGARLGATCDTGSHGFGSAPLLHTATGRHIAPVAFLHTSRVFLGAGGSS